MKRIRRRDTGGVFVGVNFMTPHIIGYYEIQRNGRTLYIELSKGRGIEREIFGVTVSTPNGRTPGGPDDLSNMFYSEEEALKYIASLEN